MSISPDAPKGENFTSQSTRTDRLPLWDSRRPGIILLKGIFWLALIIGALVALGMNYDIAWDIFVGSIIPGLETVLEVGEEALDSFYVLVGVSGAFAPMATAYTGFVLFLGLLYLVSRKAVKIYTQYQTKKQQVIDVYANAWAAWYGSVTEMAKTKFITWWNALSLTDKIVAGTFIVLIGIPIALLLSFVLGSLVANLF